MQKRNLANLAAAALLALSASPIGTALAQDGSKVTEKILGHIDSDGDGAVSLDEVGAISAQKFSGMDRNGDGALQGGEFILNESSMAKAIKKYFMLRRKAYSHLDQDGDGGVSSGEFAEMARVKFENADADGDGFLTEDEIVAFARGPGPNGDGG